MLRAVLSHATSRRDFQCMKKYSVHKNASYIMACCSNGDVSGHHPIKLIKYLSNSDQVSHPLCSNLGTRAKDWFSPLISVKTNPKRAEFCPMRPEQESMRSGELTL